MLNRQTRLHRKATAMTVVVALQALAALFPDALTDPATMKDRANASAC
jgi:hypothetical protein